MTMQMMLREVHYSGGGNFVYGCFIIYTCLLFVLCLVWGILYVQQQLLVLTGFHFVYC